MIVIKKSREIEMNNRILSFATYFPVLMLMLQLLLYLLLGESDFIHILILVGCAIPMLLSASVWIKMDYVTPTFVYLSIGCIFISQFVLFTENRSTFSNYVFYLFFMCIPCMINMWLITDWHIHNRVLLIVSHLVFIAGEVYFVCHLFFGDYYSYSMSFGYYMLLPAVVYLYTFNNSKKKRYILFFFLDAMSLLVMGSRGPVCCILFFLLFLLWENRKSLKALLLGVIAVSVLFFLYERIIVLFSNILKMFGYYSRTFDLLLQGELILHDSGRNTIREKTIGLIKEHPFFGNGIGADYINLGQYSHNILTDLMVHFGIVVGGILFIVLIVLIVRAYVVSDDRPLMGLFIAYGFIPLLVSGTYLSSIELWILLGLCINKVNVNLVLKRKC